MVLPCFSGDICRYGFLGHQASILCESLPAYRNPSVPRQPHTGNRKEASIQPLPCRSCNGISGSPWIKRMRSLPEGPHPSCPAQGSSPWRSGLFPYPSHTFMSGHIPTEETRTPGLTSLQKKQNTWIDLFTEETEHLDWPLFISMLFFFFSTFSRGWWCNVDFLPFSISKRHPLSFSFLTWYSARCI